MTPPVMKINFRLILLFLTALLVLLILVALTSLLPLSPLRLRFLPFDCTLDFVESPFYSFFKKNFGDSSFIDGRMTETLEGG